MKPDIIIFDEVGECEFCGGTGEETFDESDGEGHITRGTGTRRCRHLDD